MVDLVVHRWDWIGNGLELHYSVHLGPSPERLALCAGCSGTWDAEACRSPLLRARASWTEGAWDIEEVDLGAFGDMLRCVGLEDARSEVVIRARLRAFLEMSVDPPDERLR